MADRRSFLRTWLVVLSTVIVAAGPVACAPEAREVVEATLSGTPTGTPATPPGTATAKPANPVTYVNEEYGFSFRHPSGWDVMEGRNFVSLSQGTVTLVVGFRHVTEDPNICCREQLPEGELVDAGTVTCAGEKVERAVLECEGRITAVMYEGSEEIAVDDLRFLFYVEDFGADYETADIPEAIQQDADRLIESLETFEVSADLAQATAIPTQLPATPEPLASPTAANPTPAPAVAEAVTGGAIARSGPGPNYGVEGVLAAGERVNITGRYVNWWQIVYEGSPAWVYDEVVRTSNTEGVPVVAPDRTPDPDPETPTPVVGTGEPQTPEPTRPTAEAQTQGANVRSGPGLRYSVKGFLEGGERVEITGRYEGWWQVGYEGSPAWVHGGVVLATGVDDIPQVDSIPTPVPASPAVIPTAAPPEAIDEERWIDVSLSEQRLRAYERGEVVRTALVSTGLPQTPTPPGQFRIWIKLRYDDMSGPDYYLEDVPYVMYFYRGYGLHGTYWHSNFGQRMSAGCVNLPREEAAWVYDFADVGTLVNVRP